MPKPKEATRCPWAKDPLMIEYHDTEWGVPLHDDIRLFEAVILDGAQAGLSWLTILRKRENYRKAFHGFDPARVARYTKRDIERLLRDPGIVRNRLKVESAVDNAKGYLAIQREFGSFDAYLWGFINDKPIVHRFKTLKDIPPSTPEAETISKDLKTRGFRFVGPTIIYAMMQAIGMVNDHLVDCPRYREVGT